jgi:hypothetical protein
LGGTLEREIGLKPLRAFRVATCPEHEPIESIGLQRSNYHLVAGFHANWQLLTEIILQHPTPFMYLPLFGSSTVPEEYIC